MIKDANCDNRKYYDYEIEDYVIKDLISMSLDESKFRHNMNMNDINVSQARNDRIAQIDKQVVNLLDYISEGIAVEATKEKINPIIEIAEEIGKELEVIDILSTLELFFSFKLLITPSASSKFETYNFSS